MYEIILASASPRRKEILEKAGISCSVMVSRVNEKTERTKPEDVVVDLARKKAFDVARRAGELAIIIAADTMVVIGGKILGKPKDRAEAVKMLLQLQGNTHRVYTGVAFVIKDMSGEDRKRSFFVETKVSISAMTMAQIEAYADTGEPLDKAGGYGIQGRFSVFVNRIEGDYYNVVGLPIQALYKALLDEGIALIK